jgi:alkaline phosphatase
MKNAILAAAMAVASVLSFAPQSHAETVVVTTRDHRGPPHHYRPHHPPRHCYVKKVRTYHNHRVVIKTQRVCR